MCQHTPINKMDIVLRLSLRMELFSEAVGRFLVIVPNAKSI